MRHRCLASTVAVIALAGCGEVITTPATSTTTAVSTSSSGTTVTTGTGGAGGAPPTDTVTLTAAAVRSPGGTPLPGVKVCVYAQPTIPCETTDDQGLFSIPVPSFAETGVLLEKQGSGSVLLPFVTLGDDLGGWMIGMPAATAISNFYDPTGHPYPADETFLEVWTNQGQTEKGLAGMAISLSPATGAGPFYAAPGGAAPDLGLAATSSEGSARFAGITDPVVAVKLAPSSHACEVRFGGWPQDGATLRVPLVVGFETHASFACD
jgi:hypothetical protein